MDGKVGVPADKRSRCMNAPVYYVGGCGVEEGRVPPILDRVAALAPIQ
jgi:hypothetical protein